MAPDFAVRGVGFGPKDPIPLGAEQSGGCSVGKTRGIWLLQTLFWAVQVFLKTSEVG